MSRNRITTDAIAFTSRTNEQCQSYTGGTSRQGWQAYQQSRVKYETWKQCCRYNYTQPSTASDWLLRKGPFLIILPRQKPLQATPALRTGRSITRHDIRHVCHVTCGFFAQSYLCVIALCDSFNSPRSCRDTVDNDSVTSSLNSSSPPITHIYNLLIVHLLGLRLNMKSLSYFSIRFNNRSSLKPWSHVKIKLFQRILVIRETTSEMK